MISCLQEAKGVASGSNGRGAVKKKSAAKTGAKRRARVPKEQQQEHPDGADDRWGCRRAVKLCGRWMY